MNLIMHLDEIISNAVIFNVTSYAVFVFQELLTRASVVENTMM